METDMGKADEAGTRSQECWEGEAVAIRSTWLLHVACYLRDFSFLMAALLSRWNSSGSQFSQKMEPSDFRLPAFLQTQA